MFRTGLAAILSGALAVAGVTATPARADDNDAAIAAVVLGALALFAVTNSQRKDQNSAVVERAPRYRDTSPEVRHHNGRYARVLPGVCGFDVESRNGVRRFVSGHCLSRRGYRASLPDQCEYRIRTSNGTRSAYPMICLDRYGYRLTGHRHR